MIALDAMDVRILTEIQANARISNHELAERVGLSPSPCWRRMRRLEDEGVIASYAALLNPEAIGLHITAYAHVMLENHHAETVALFDGLIADQPAVLECCSTSGEYDYLLKVVAPSMSAYEAFLSGSLMQNPAVRSVSTSFVLKQKKTTTMLPLAPNS
ncbi:Lrp/AsnC family transcriptional regulator [Govanella unica]|uniref:Lrp/AsnC family transcriptional regulator n=1 Tax=Govanella unica TaxID=2975056 RepID=A0A9X3Z6E7_9PROT|nr:Lrp/AsnC family transcriptional regulator [Govania unica]MDA5193140.1 Lrp/AsnC family transcriptional regulator [Govania unica]